ncbi:MAG: hypothetical protein F6K16_14845 [Symploca sp. SIO2B6]|nr:hypothetical protein [Symploca sp. SIO2B6]
MPFININSDEYHQYHQQMNTILRKLPSLIQMLTLTLPAKPKSIYHNVHQFSQIQQILDHARKSLVVLAQNRYPVSYCGLSDRLIFLIEHLLEYTDTLLHLAQEYPIDPTGVTQCWVGLAKDNAHFLQEVSQLQMAIACLPIPQPWGQSLRQAGQSLRSTVASLTPSALN